jgi:hypothetical protein
MPKSKRIKRSVWERTKTRPRKWSPHMFKAGAAEASHRKLDSDVSRVKRLTFDMSNEV